MIRVLVVDDDVTLHDALRYHLERRGTLSVVGVAADGNTAVRLTRQLTPDVVVMDVMLRGALSGLDAARQIRRDRPECRVVAFTGSSDPRVIRDAVRAGMCGYVGKAAPGGDIVSAAEAAARGETCFPPGVAVDIDPGLELTPLDLQVLRLRAAGLNTKQIGFEIGRSEDTVEYHLRKLMRVLDIRTDAALIKYAIQTGLVTLDL